MYCTYAGCRFCDLVEHEHVDENTIRFLVPVDPLKSFDLDEMPIE